MKIMSINAGSSSLKFSLFDMDTNAVLVSGLFERIGIDGSCYTFKNSEFKIKQEAPLKDHSDAVKILLDKLIELKIINSLEEIDGIGHRIVHGGASYTESVVVTDKVIEDKGTGEVNHDEKHHDWHHVGHLAGHDLIELGLVWLFAVGGFFHELAEGLGVLGFFRRKLLARNTELSQGGA